MHKIITKKGIEVDAIFIKDYGTYGLYFAQERLILVNGGGYEVRGLDVIDFIMQ